MNEVSLSRVVVSQEGDRLYSFEYAARVTETSVTLVEGFVEMVLIEARGSMLRSQHRSHQPNSSLASGFGAEFSWSGNGFRHGLGNRTVEGTVEGIPVTAFIRKLQREKDTR